MPRFIAWFIAISAIITLSVACIPAPRPPESTVAFPLSQGARLQDSTASPAPKSYSQGTHTALPPTSTAVPLPGSLAFRDGRSVAVLSPLDGIKVLRFQEDASHPSSPTFSPDCLSIAFSVARETETGPQSDIVVASLQTAKSRVVASSPLEEAQPSWSPDARSLAIVVDGGNLDLVSVESRERSRLVSSAGGVFSPTWSPIRNQIAYVESSPEAKSIRIYDVDSGASTTVDTGSVSPDVWGLSWSPDGKVIAFSDTDGRLYTVDVELGIPAHVLSPPGTVEGISWAPNGSAIAFTVKSKGADYRYRWDIFLFDFESRSLATLTTSGQSREPDFCGIVAPQSP